MVAGRVTRDAVRRWIFNSTVVLSLGWFGYHTILLAWSNPSTDFPNYYTAAKLAREHQPLHLFYDWTWFQRQMHFAGIEDQLGGYIPQTPLALLPFAPLSLTDVVNARKIWLLLNCAFLALTLWLLSRMTRLNVAQLWLIAFLAGAGLRNNFLLGQYYVLLLALLTGGVYCMFQGRDRSAGALLGLAFVLKLYGGPMLLLAVVARRWRVAAAFLAVFFLAAAGGAVWFGVDETLRYCTSILPRSLAGETLNPFHPSNGTATTLLRRVFLKEAELNPDPAFENPFLFFACQTAFTLSVMCVLLAGKAITRRTVSWWLVGILLISTNTASYTFVLLILPIALLFDEMARYNRIVVIGILLLSGMPLRPEWSWLFPKLWLLLLLFSLTGYPQLSTFKGKYAMAVAALVLIVSAGAGIRGARLIRDEPAVRFQQVAFEPGAIYSNSPAASNTGLFYESINEGHYVIRNDRSGFESPGDTFHPAIPDSGSPVYAESVTRTVSSILRLDPATRHGTALLLGVEEPERPAVTHDGDTLAFLSKGQLYVHRDGRSQPIPILGQARSVSFAPGDDSLVFASEQGGVFYVGRTDLAGQSSEIVLRTKSELAAPSLSPDGRTLLFAMFRESKWQVWIKALDTGREHRVTGGNCNSFSPAWRSGTRQIVFASDCGRGLGLPALYMTGPLNAFGDVVSESLHSKAGVPLAPAVH